MNCKNCGAPVHGRKCEYCGTEYSASEIFKVENTSKELMEIFSNGKVYVEEVIREPIFIEPYRNENGTICHPAIKYKTKVKLVEV